MGVAQRPCGAENPLCGILPAVCAGWSGIGLFPDLVGVRGPAIRGGSRNWGRVLCGCATSPPPLNDNSTKIQRKPSPVVLPLHSLVWRVAESPDFAFLLEFCAPAHRGRIMVVNNMGGVLGYVVLTGMAFLSFEVWPQQMGWRVFTILSSVPPVLVALLRLLLREETPHYLVAQGRIQEASQLLTRMFRVAGVSGSPVVASLLSDAFILLCWVCRRVECPTKEFPPSHIHRLKMSLCEPTRMGFLVGCVSLVLWRHHFLEGVKFVFHKVCVTLLAVCMIQLEGGRDEACAHKWCAAFVPSHMGDMCRVRHVSGLSTVYVCECDIFCDVHFGTCVNVKCVSCVNVTCFVEGPCPSPMNATTGTRLPLFLLLHRRLRNLRSGIPS